jgi:hypothetical protein
MFEQVPILAFAWLVRLVHAAVHKIAFAYKANDFKAIYKWRLDLQTQAEHVPACSKLNVGSYANGFTSPLLMERQTKPYYSRPALQTPNWLNLPPFNILLQ